MIRRQTILVILLSFCFILPGCGDNPADPEENCELVTQGNSFLKVVNTSGSDIDVFFIGFAFEALINNDKCEIFGLPAGNRSVDVEKRPNGPTRQVNFSVDFGQTFTLRVDTNFF